jgi:hypothetical protein
MDVVLATTTTQRTSSPKGEKNRWQTLRFNHGYDNNIVNDAVETSFLLVQLDEYYTSSLVHNE